MLDKEQVINASVGYKNLKIIEMRKNYLTEQRKVG